MSKHTPGPWHVANRQPGHGEYRICAAGNWMIAAVPPRYPRPDCEPLEANARLIAAAPALAEALKAWMAFHAESRLPNCDPQERMRLRRIAMTLSPAALKQAGIEE